jgi:hypothetical protein
MLGRSVNAGYRRDLNLLSQRDYTLSRGRYIAIYIREIVGTAIVAMANPPRFNLRNWRWPIWQAASTDRRSDERLPTS